ncbi:tyrosine--tRNA ligase [Propionicimonas sp.]|uniref:tyrosine--tRNA ligase n=1 Tax=Propionicimonas sp. TaxID=1955623 RepID=UPI00180075A9|nr:tyrosine--tRNA ligase [Propionicimonas sp.]MBU3976275.1 tyrosine--tRNA ligase [Actinomycetota bacterium]MBA3021087.1 tyrosine--tRNA ligase [Propionicimonas sp.]MBU3985670.1 tyrosine--tRNA ligase [Actinomycetota bacterium]MBU4008455.1 tyrosine--tRNA ligase [Actinomycetota bacterium]MBU4066395.1 tyrosine--tRNA ligase [Actinomycetota bacterium]
MNALLEELTWRGFVAHSTDPDALAAALDAGQVKSYVGFDPTAPSIHMGNLVQLMLSRRLQAAGHRPFLLVGGSTGLIGDPRQTSERNLNPKDLVHEWVERIRDQVSKFVDFDGPNSATVVNNYDWTAELSTLDFLRDIGKHFSVNRMLDREVVKARLETGISYTEFSYMLLQSLDFLELYRRHGVTMQTGGSDQWGNLTSGVELIRRADGGKAHALATPLLTKADGTKFGKTESGTVWLDPAMTSPYAFHQFFLNAEDAMAATYLRIFSERGREELDDLVRQSAEAPHLRIAQRALADDITDLVHSPAERVAATQAAAAIFGGGELRDLPAAVLKAVNTELGGVELAIGTDFPSVVEVMVAAGVVPSKSAGRRTVAEGGAYLNNVKVTDPEQLATADDLLAEKFLVVRRGRKTVGAVEITRLA